MTGGRGHFEAFGWWGSRARHRRVIKNYQTNGNRGAGGGLLQGECASINKTYGKHEPVALGRWSRMVIT
jgi:hypothetical protein